MEAKKELMEVLRMPLEVVSVQKEAVGVFLKS
jgi:hypothetical protein